MPNPQPTKLICRYCLEKVDFVDFICLSNLGEYFRPDAYIVHVDCGPKQSRTCEEVAISGDCRLIILSE